MTHFANHPGVDSAVTAAGLSGLLKHLHRSGVMFVPKSDVVAAVATALAASPAAAQPPVMPPAVAPEVTASGPVRPAQPAVASTPPAARYGHSPAAAPVSPPASSLVTGAYAGVSLPLDQRRQRLVELSEQVAGCSRCETLACSRRQTVFGEGNPAARVCFLGDAPAAEEDATGRPFVGQAGQLLTKMIEACTFSREQVYLLNTIKCRPPGVRMPDAVELGNCRSFLEQQLEIIRPQYIVCLGLTAAQTLLDSKLTIGRLRGRFHSYRESKVLAIYHPSYLNRNPSAKKEAWSDLQMLMREMGILAKRS